MPGIRAGERGPETVDRLELPVGVDVDAKLAFDLPVAVRSRLVRLGLGPDRQPIPLRLPGRPPARAGEEARPVTRQSPAGVGYR